MYCCNGLITPRTEARCLVAEVYCSFMQRWVTSSYGSGPDMLYIWRSCCGKSVSTCTEGKETQQTTRAFKKNNHKKNTVCLPVAALSVPESHRNLCAFSLFLRLPSSVYTLLIFPVDVEFRTLKQTGRSISETGRRHRRTRSSARTFSPSYSISESGSSFLTSVAPILEERGNLENGAGAFWQTFDFYFCSPVSPSASFPLYLCFGIFKASTWNCCQYVFRAIAR